MVYKTKHYPDGSVINYPVTEKTSPPEKGLNDVKKNGIELDNKKRKKIRCAGFYIFAKRQSYIKWITFTLPTTTQEIGIHEVFNTDRFYASAFSAILNRLQKNRREKFRYVWVAERQAVRGAIHFHLLADIPEKINISWLNDTWCRLISDSHEYSKNAVDVVSISKEKSSEKPSLVNYMAKYMNKSNTRFFCALWGSDRETSKAIKGIEYPKEYDQTDFTDYLYIFTLDKNTENSVNYRPHEITIRFLKSNVNQQIIKKHYGNILSKKSSSSSE